MERLYTLAEPVDRKHLASLRGEMPEFFNKSLSFSRNTFFLLFQGTTLAISTLVQQNTAPSCFLNCSYELCQSLTFEQWMKSVPFFKQSTVRKLHSEKPTKQLDVSLNPPTQAEIKATETKDRGQLTRIPPR